jgi:Uncharacterized homolog of PSP1
MAKDQELVLNVAKLSGLCGRLMCCLRYEFDGDPKDIAIDDEPIPQDEPVSSRSSDTTMASILSTITEEDKETDTVDAYSEDKHPNKIETIAFKGNKTAIEHRSQETSSGPQQRHDNNRDDNKKPDRKGFKRRKYFKK